MRMVAEKVKKKVPARFEAEPFNYDNRSLDDWENIIIVRLKSINQELDRKEEGDRIIVTVTDDGVVGCSDPRVIVKAV